MRENQPPDNADFLFRSIDWDAIFTLHETSGTSGTPKTFFLTWEDWERYAQKYARIFISQGFRAGDRIVVCASYGMNVGANTMTLAARDIGITIIPEGKCTFPGRVIKYYKRLVVGGESFSEESRAYLAELWGCEVYNTYGSTEGTMCGECTDMNGLHVPEDLVHLGSMQLRKDAYENNDSPA